MSGGMSLPFGQNLTEPLTAPLTMPVRAVTHITGGGVPMPPFGFLIVLDVNTGLPKKNDAGLIMIKEAA